MDVKSTATKIVKLIGGPLNGQTVNTTGRKQCLEFEHGVAYMTSRNGSSYSEQRTRAIRSKIIERFARFYRQDCTNIGDFVEFNMLVKAIMNEESGDDE
jgi:hypothetical protein